MKRFGLSVLGGAVALLSASVFGAGIFSSGVAEAAFPGADSFGVISQQCMPDGTTQATFGWTSYNQGAQWIDISTTDPGFSPNSYISTGPIASGQNSFGWNGLQGGVTYFARIDTQTAYGWVPSAPVTFVSQACNTGYVPGTYGYVAPQAPVFVQPYVYNPAPVIVPQAPFFPAPVVAHPPFHRHFGHRRR